MKSSYSLSLLLSMAALILAGCENAPATSVVQVDPRAPAVINATQISPQEWAQASDKLVTNLLASGVLDKAPEHPAVMAVSRIVNNTQQQIDTDSLIKKIRVALNQSGKVVTTTTLALGGRAEDQLAKEAAEYSQFMNGQKQESKMPYYTLSGKLLEDRVRQQANTSITYTFQMSLTEVKSGLAVWEAEEQLAKLAHKPAVAW